MKVVVIGGTGLIGSKVVAKLNQHGHEAIAAAPNTGVNTLTGEGLADALTGAQVVVDVANSPSFSPGLFPPPGNLNRAPGPPPPPLPPPPQRHFPQNARNTQDRPPFSFPAPFFILRPPPPVRISSASIQPMAADDVATAVARTAVGQPVGGILEVTGPDRYPLDDLVRARLRANNDTRRVVTDPQSRYFGVLLDDHTLVPGPDATVFPTRFEDWLIDNALAPVK